MEHLKVWLLERANRMLSPSSADFVCTVPNEGGEVRTGRPANDWRLDGRCIRVEKDVLLLDLEGSERSSAICFWASLTSAVGSNQGAFGAQNRCISLSSSCGRLRRQLQQGGSAKGNDGAHHHHARHHLEMGSNLWPSVLVFSQD